MAASQSQNSWRFDLLALCESINKIVEDKRAYINEQQCFVVKLLADYIQQYVNQWMKICGEEIWWKELEEVGKKLHTVLDRGLQLMILCGEKPCPDIAFVTLGCKGVLGEIIDDASIYAQMLNRSILMNSVLHDVEKLMFDVELNCNSLHFYLEMAYQHDKNTLRNSLRDTGWSLFGRCPPTALLFGRWPPTAPVSSLLLMLKNIEEPNIDDSDLFMKGLVGRGSFGTVQSAEWHKIPVAVKSLEKDEDFQSELEVFHKLLNSPCSKLHSDSPCSKLHSDSPSYKKLQHADSPHIVCMLGYSANKKLVLELMDKDLEKQITELKSPLPLTQSLDLILQIAKAMRHLHSRDVVHRDLKPANVLLKSRKDGSLLIKLTDFGISKESFETATRNTSWRGTPMYMAPEMLNGNGNYSRKVDVYSFGLICLETLAGKMRKKREDQLDLPKDIPGKLQSLINSCQRETAESRPSFEDICESLWLVKEEVLTKITDTEAKEMKFIIQVQGLQGIRIENIPSASTFTGKRAILFIKPSDIRKGLRDFPADSLFDILLDSPAYPQPSGQLKNDWPEELDLFVEQFQKLVKDQGKKINLYFRIGGYDYSERIRPALATSITRARFVESVVSLLKKSAIYNGLVIDCTYLSDEGQNANADVGNLVLTLKELRKELTRHVGSITIAINLAHNLWQVQEIEKAVHLVDQVHVGYPTLNKDIASHVSPLYPSSSSKQLSIDEIVKLCRERVSSSKLFIKAELFCYEYPNTDGIGRPASNGHWGSILYSDLPAPGSEEMWDDEAKAAYAYDSNRRLLFSYDNVKSVLEKAKYIKENDLGGIVVYWAFADFCYNHERSVIKALHDHLTHG